MDEQLHFRSTQSGGAGLQNSERRFADAKTVRVVQANKTRDGVAEIGFMPHHQDCFGIGVLFDQTQKGLRRGATSQVVLNQDFPGLCDLPKLLRGLPRPNNGAGEYQFWKQTVFLAKMADLLRLFPAFWGEYTVEIRIGKINRFRMSQKKETHECENMARDPQAVT